MDDKFVKRLRKKSKRGMRGWPLATVAFYGPDMGWASKVAVGIVPSKGAGASEIRDWKLETGDVRTDPVIAEQILAFIEAEGALTVVMTDGIIGCPHQEGIDYEGEWCPACTFWHGRDRSALMRKNSAS